MEQIIIGFSKSKKKWAPFSQLIRWSEGTEYSHCYIKFYSESLNRWFVYQASHTMVNFASVALFESQNETIKEFYFNVSTCIKKKMMNFCIDNCAKPYGVASIFGLAAVIIASWFGKQISNPLKDGSATFVCSELIAELLKESTNLVFNEEIDSILPRDLYKIVEGLPGVLI